MKQVRCPKCKGKGHYDALTGLYTFHDDLRVCDLCDGDRSLTSDARLACDLRLRAEQVNKLQSCLGRVGKLDALFSEEEQEVATEILGALTRNLVAERG
jgi:hypothetical protein